MKSFWTYLRISIMHLFLFSLESLVYFSNTSYLDQVLASYFPPAVFLFCPILYLTVLLYKKFSAVTLLPRSSYCLNYWTKVKISSLLLMISQCFTVSVLLFTILLSVAKTHKGTIPGMFLISYHCTFVHAFPLPRIPFLIPPFLANDTLYLLITVSYS